MADKIVQYQKADIFCLPSYFEGFPNVVCEAMSCGLPILASNVCDNANIVSEGENGVLFNPQSIDEISLAVITMLERHQEELNRMSSTSRLRAQELFSLKAFVNDYISII